MAVSISEYPRGVGRTTAGIPMYVSSTTLYKGNSSTPTSFSAVTGDPFGTCYNMAIDGNDVCWMVYIVAAGMGTNFNVVSYDVDADTWGTPTTIESSAINQADPSIVIDSNNVPHIFYNLSVSNMGSNYGTIKYVNRVGGSWNTAVTVYGAPEEVNVFKSSGTIDSSNFPCVSFHTASGVRHATSTSNNPSSFSSSAVSTVDGTYELKLTKDSNGDNYYTYLPFGAGAYDRRLYDVAAATDTLIDTTPASIQGGLTHVPVGTDIYCFYGATEGGESFVDKLAYKIWDGSSLGSENVIINNSSVSANSYITQAKWSNYNNRGSDGANYAQSSASIPEIDIYYFNSVGSSHYFDTITPTVAEAISAPNQVLIW